MSEVVKSKQSQSLLVRALCEGGLMVVLAQVLGYLKLWKMPWGGSVSLIMVPIIIYACRWGVKNGLIAAFALGILQFMFDGGIAIGWQSILGDYVLAYGAVGLAGLFTGKKWSVYAGAVLGCLARFVVHYITGATLWAVYMPDKFFGMTMTSPWIYSGLYNMAYILPNLVLTLVVLVVLSVPLKKYFVGSDIRK